MAIRGTVDARLIVDPGLRNFFQNSLNPRQQKSMIMSAYRKSAKPLVTAAKGNLRSRRSTKNTGSSLYKALGVKPNSRKVIMLVGSRTYKSFTGFHGHLVEYGTKQRFRKTKTGKRVPTGRVKPMRFWTDALRSTADTVGNSITKNIEITLLDWTKKKGIRI